MEIDTVLATDQSCKILEQFQLVSHHYVSNHSSMEKQTKLVGQPINLVMLIYFFGSVPIRLPFFPLVSVFGRLVEPAL